MKSIACPKFLLLVVFLTFTPCFAADRGILVKPDAEGNFRYTDSFSSHKFLEDAFLENLSVGNYNWHDQVVNSAGPEREHALTYRFYSRRQITSIDVHVEQGAKPDLGGRNLLYLSSDGRAWILVASSEKQKADEEGWQREPFAISQQQAEKFTNCCEIWIRIVMANNSGTETDRSNQIDAFTVKLKLGQTKTIARLEKLAAWGKLRQVAGYKSITLDCADPADYQPPHYYEDADGWLQPPGANPNLVTNEDKGFLLRRAYSYYYTSFSPLSLVMFVNTDSDDGAMMARITVHSSDNSSQQMNVLWDGKLLETFDTTSYFDEENYFVEVPASKRKRLHELRITCADKRRPLLIKRVSLVGAGSVQWAQKPKLPAGGSLKVLSAYYMPDQKPPENTQAVSTKRKMGFLYKEYAEFGGVRLVVKNSSPVPVRIANTLLLNGKPIEDSYIDLNLQRGWDPNTAYDLQGVIWYRIRPKLLEPGDCAQLYIRFRRRPAGDKATVTIPLENGKPLKVTIPYKDTGLAVDYVTTNKSQDTLYVYARRCEGAKVGKVKKLRFNGKVVKNAKIYGADFPGNVALIVAKLSQPLNVGDYHIVGVQTDAGTAIDAQFKVLPFLFVRSAIGTPENLLTELNINVITWNERNRQVCEEYNVLTTTQWGKVYDLQPRIAFAIGLDEPDAQYDPQGSRGPGGLGRCARQTTQQNRWNELLQRFAPKVATWAMIDGSFRPLNWAIYGHWCDIACTDPYITTFLHGDHTYVRECLSMLRRYSAPRRLYYTAEAFGWKLGEGVPEDSRGPVPAEYRQNVVQGIGCGIKGLTSWIYSASGGGWQIDHPIAKQVGKEIGKLNALIKYIEDDLLIGTPIDLAASDAGLVQTGPIGTDDWFKEQRLSKDDLKNWLKDRVWVSSLLCGPDKIIIAAVNHIPATSDYPTSIEPTTDVTVTVQLPKFLRNVKAFEVTEEGISPYPHTLDDGKVLIKLDSIESGRVFLLQRE